MAIPLLQLPGPALGVLVALLPAESRRTLRLCSTAAAAAVDTHITRLTITHMGPFKPLQQRFPHLQKLHLMDNTHGLGSPLAWGPLDAILQQEQWPSVASLCLLDTPASIAMQAINISPNATEFVVQAFDGASLGRQLLHHACSALCALRAPEFNSLDFRLNDDDLRQLAACQSLVDLRTARLECTQAGVDALCGMSLESLGFSFPANALNVSLSSFSRLTTLAHLKVYNVEEELQRSLRLPTSLVSLHHLSEGLELGAMRVMPSLTQIKGLGADLTDWTMALLAASCPHLEDLVLGWCKVNLTQACHTSPMQHVTHLEVYDSSTTTNGMRFSTAFPQLQLMELHGNQWFGEGIACFEHATTLTALDISAYLDDTDLYLESSVGHMGAHDFAVLGALPRLRSLRLDATPSHVEGMGAHMPFLQDVQWVCGIKLSKTCHVLSALQGAFGAHTAPEGLRTVKFLFIDNPFYEDDDIAGDPHFNLLDSINHWPAGEGHVIAHLNGQAIRHVADSAVAWLLSAPRLSTVVWEHDNAGCTCFNDAYLSALAGHGAINRIVLSSMGGLSAAVLQRACDSGRLEVIFGRHLP